MLEKLLLFGLKVLIDIFPLLDPGDVAASLLQRTAQLFQMKKGSSLKCLLQFFGIKHFNLLLLCTLQ